MSGYGSKREHCDNDVAHEAHGWGGNHWCSGAGYPRPIAKPTPMTLAKVLWDVDVDVERDTQMRISGFQPFATDEHGNVLFSINMWFKTEAECRAWISNTIINAVHSVDWS